MDEIERLVAGCRRYQGRLPGNNSFLVYYIFFSVCFVSFLAYKYATLRFCQVMLRTSLVQDAD